MGWWSSDDSSSDSSSGGYDSSSFSSGSSFDNTPSYSNSMPSTDIREQILREQQKVLIQNVISKLTELAFKECVSKPDTALSNKEMNCITNITSKYLDASEFVIGRMTQQQGGHH